MLPPGAFRSTPFCPWLPFFADLAPEARSPWSPPAATGGACLDPASLADFCQPSRMPGHTWRASVPHAKRRFRSLAVLDLERPGTVSGPGVPTSRRNAGRTGRGRPSQRARGGSRGQLRLPRAPRCHRNRSCGVGSPARSRPAKTPSRTSRANGDDPRGGRRRFPLPRNRPELPSRSDCHGPPRNEEDRANAPFSRARITRLDGRMTPQPAAAHTRRPVGYRPSAG